MYLVRVSQTCRLSIISLLAIACEEVMLLLAGGEHGCDPHAVGLGVLEYRPVPAQPQVVAVEAKERKERLKYGFWYFICYNLVRTEMKQTIQLVDSLLATPFWLVIK